LEQQTEEDSSRGSVHPVYLRCSQGSVSWLYPRGALRVVLRLGTAGKEFQVTFFFFFSYLFKLYGRQLEEFKKKHPLHLLGTIKKSNFLLHIRYVRVLTLKNIFLLFKMGFGHVITIDQGRFLNKRLIYFIL